MGKLLLVVLVFAAVYFIVRAYARSLAARKNEAAGTQAVEDMVRCAHCGVHLPRSDSIVFEDHTYCSREHQRLHGP